MKIYSFFVNWISIYTYAKFSISGIIFGLTLHQTVNTYSIYIERETVNIVPNKL